MTKDRPIESVLVTRSSVMLFSSYNPAFIKELKTRTRSRQWTPDAGCWTLTRDEEKVALEIMLKHFPHAIVEVNK